MRLLVFACAWVLGLSFARHIPIVSATLWLAILVGSASCWLLFRRRVVWWLLAGIFAFCAGGFRQALVPTSSPIAEHNGFSGSVIGTVVREPERRADRLRLRLESEAIFVNSVHSKTSGLVLVEARLGAAVGYGDRIRATGRLATPETWDAFSYADYLARQGVFSMMRGAAVEVLDRGHGSDIYTALLRVKAEARKQIESVLPDPQASLVTGILLGDESGMSPELRDAFERAGASHIVAISGFNMVIVSGIVVRALSGIFRDNQTVVALNVISVIAVYTLLVGASPGVVRAALMSSLLVIGSLMKRKTFVPTSLAFATLLLSLGDPNVLLDIGFQLSFFAVLGLCLFADPLSSRFRRLLGRYLPAGVADTAHSFLNEPLIVSLAAQIATLPLAILYFGRLSLVALPVNLLIVPVQAAVLLLGMAGTVAYAFVPALGTLVFWAEFLFLSWTIAIVRGFAALPFADLPLQLDGRIIQVGYLLLLGGAMARAARPDIWRRIQTLFSRNLALISAISSAGIALILTGAMFSSRADGRLHLWLLDLGHSNAALMQTPGGAQVLVDGGRYPARLLTAIGDRLPFYDREIELLAITHPDGWDSAALGSLLERYTAGAALYHGQPNLDGDFEAILERLRRAGAPIQLARAGHTIDFSDGVQIEVLHPQSQPRITDRLNDQVLVLRVTYGEVSFLLTSDLSVAGQRKMLEAGVSPLAAVLQIPRHGTARALDSDFLAAIQPQVALLQSDVANRRGDPDPDTMAMLNDIPLFRTDEMGTIHLHTDGKTLTVEAG